MYLLVLYIAPGDGIFQGSDPDKLFLSQLFLRQVQNSINRKSSIFSAMVMPVIGTVLGSSYYFLFRSCSCKKINTCGY